MLTAGHTSNRALLNWTRRLEIILGIAHGVAYLHEGSGESIIHGNLKSGNILLDDEWKPKIANFGTAKLFTADQTGHDQLIIVSP
jgi:serine/threonine protein kinase